MITISEKSWHYRFMRALNVWPEDRTNVCSYVRGFLWATIKTLFMTTIVAIMAYVVLFALYSLGYALLAGWMDWPTTTVTAYVVGVFLWVFICAAGIAHVTTEVYRRRERVYKPDGPFKQYIKDKHNKVCSFIEFKD